jgi:Ca2+-binding RTX toxin-like protein
MLTRTHIAQNGTGQIHTFDASGSRDQNNWDNLQFSKITSFSHGHHVRTGSGNDTINFKNINEVSSVIVGRIEDFDSQRDTLRIEGQAIYLNNLPANVRIVEFNGAHNDAGSQPQQWILITTPAGGSIFYAFEGARVDMNNNGGANSGAQESHFISRAQLPDFSKLKTVPYVDPQNVVPTGIGATNGITINDVDVNTSDVLERIVGTGRDDLIAAGLNDDVVRGYQGNDQIWGGSGNDTVYGEDGNDILNGGTGSDKLYGGNGNDRIDGGLHDDVIVGANGNDLLIGNNGHDWLIGGEGNDRLYGGYLADRLDGGNGADLLLGQHGSDRLFGGSGSDLLRGDDGNDYLDGGANGDRLFGGNGNDILLGQNGNDLLLGGSGADILGGGGGNDRIYGGSGNDRIYGGNSADLLVGQDGDDRIVGGYGADRIAGGNGNDHIYGGGHDDRLYGGNGNDVVLGVHGKDIVFGNFGNDRLVGGDGNDQLFGGMGRDVLYGQNGNDRISGGMGADILAGGAGADVFDFKNGDMVDWDDLNGTWAQKNSQLDVITDFTVGSDIIDFVGYGQVKSIDDISVWSTTIDGNLYFTVNVIETNERMLVDVDDTMTWSNFCEAENFLFH